MQMPNTCKRVCKYSTMTHPLVAYLNPNQSIDCYALITDLSLSLLFYKIPHKTAKTGNIFV